MIRLPVTILLLVPLGVASVASASVARAVSFQEKVEVADAIVLGTVVSSESRRDGDGRWIVTTSTFEVERALKGSAAPRIAIVTPGGSVDGVRQETIGVPSFRPGDEHVVFVRHAPSGASSVAFFDQGVYDVRRDERGRRVVRPRPTQLVLVDQTTGRAAMSEPATPRSLEAFEAEVGRALRARPERGALARMQANGSTVRGWKNATAEFMGEHWKILTLVGVGLLLALVPILLRMRS